MKQRGSTIGREKTALYQVSSIKQIKIITHIFHLSRLIATGTLGSEMEL